VSSLTFAATEMAVAELEYNTLLQCYEKITEHLAASESLAAALVGKGLITFQVLNELSSLKTPQEKADKTAQTVILSVKATPALFNDFIAVLQNKNLLVLVRILQDKKSKWFEEC